MDSSDLKSMNKLGCSIFEDKLPIDPHRELKLFLL